MPFFFSSPPSLCRPDADRSTSFLVWGCIGVYQQASSVVSSTNQMCYEVSAAPCFSVYGFEVRRSTLRLSSLV